MVLNGTRSFRAVQEYFPILFFLQHKSDCDVPRVALRRAAAEPLPRAATRQESESDSVASLTVNLGRNVDLPPCCLTSGRISQLPDGG